MRIEVLGPLRVHRGSTAIELGSPKPRALLAALALHANRPVPVDTLIDFLWGRTPPAAVTASLHAYVSSLRKVLEPGRAARAAAQTVLTSPAGYELRVPADAVDAHRFARVVQDVHARLTGADPLTVPAGLTAEALTGLTVELTGALSWWRAEPYPELDRHPAADAERARLADLRLAALADRARLHLALGQESTVVADLGPVAHDHPLREDLWALFALALARAGRQGDALHALRTVRQSLDAELGIDPGPLVRELELAVLRQDVVTARSVPGSVPGAGPAPGPDPTALPAAVAMTGPVTVRSGAPLVGRERELSALLGVLDDAEAGSVRIALLVGEPGIGKTRLTEELGIRARARGFGVHVGRCSSDDGAPPLWPWVGVLGSLAESRTDDGLAEAVALVRADRPGGADRFTRFESVARALARITAGERHLLVFDDLHWADPSTLALLRHITDTVDRGRLAVVVTRRAHPAPTGGLAELGEALARRPAVGLDLSGLSVADVTALSAAHRPDVPADGAALRERTGGNPFFLLELLRAADPARGPDPGVGGVPAAVTDVIAARVGRLPAPTQEILRVAAVAGRAVDPDLLAGAANLDPDGVLDVLEPAVEAGLLVVTGTGELQFGHALVRDAIEANDSALRRPRRHAAVAGALLDRDRSGHRRAEIARHWLRAGPAHVARAWPAAVAAATEATGLAAHEEAAALLAAALHAQSADRTTGPGDRHDLLLARAAACRAAADNEGQRAATTEAIEIARRLGDVERIALAGIAAAEGGLWSNVPEGAQHPVTVDALRTAARDLPEGDSPLRCRVFLALSRELFWTAPGGDGHPAERVAHAERGFAMARRLGEPRLQSFACRTLSLAVMGPSTLDRRTALTEESIECARAAGDPDGAGVGLFWRAVHAGEAGRIAERRIAAAEAMEHADRHGLRMLQVMLGAYQSAWLALEGRFEQADALLADNLRQAALATFPFRTEAVTAARATIALWRGEPEVTLELFRGLTEATATDTDTGVLIGLIRSGRLAPAAAMLDRRPVSLDADSFAAPFDFAILAEAALVVGRPELAGRLYPLMLPWAGRTAAAGTGPPLGPIDAFLAAAAAAVGEIDVARRHADDAARLCASWPAPVVADWLADLRARYGF